MNFSLLHGIISILCLRMKEGAVFTLYFDDIPVLVDEEILSKLSRLSVDPDMKSTGCYHVQNRVSESVRMAFFAWLFGDEIPTLTSEKEVSELLSLCEEVGYKTDGGNLVTFNPNILDTPKTDEFMRHLKERLDEHDMRFDELDSRLQDMCDELVDRISQASLRTDVTEAMIRRLNNSINDTVTSLTASHVDDVASVRKEIESLGARIEMLKASERSLRSIHLSSSQGRVLTNHHVVSRISVLR